MLTRYCLLLTLDEVYSLPQVAKEALAKLDKDFAVVCGIPTAENPAAAPSNPRPVAAQPDGTTVLLPEKNQINQQDSPYYTAHKQGGIPGMPVQSSTPLPPSHVVPMAVPQSTGVPQSVPQTPQVAPPMNGAAIPGSPVFSPPQPQQAAQPQFTPQAAPAPQQFAPQQQPQQVNQPLTVEYVRNTLIPQRLAEQGPPAVLNLIAKAHQAGIIERNSLDCLTPQNVQAFVDVLNRG